MDIMGDEHRLLGEGAKPHPENLMHAGEPTIDVILDFDSAAPFFRELEAGGVVTAFQTRLWLECWLARLARPKGVRMVFCIVRSPRKCTLMVLPLCLRMEAGLRIVEGNDLGVSDYFAPVMASAFNPSSEEWAALWRRIVAALPSHDVLRLTKIPCHIGGRANPLASTPGAFKLELQAHGVAVSAPWPACANQVFSSNRREKLKKGWRDLGRQGEIRFRVAHEPGEMADLFDQLVAQRLLRFKALQRHDPLHDPDIVAFYKSVIAQGAASGFARLPVIEVGGRMVAMQFGVCHAGAFHLLIQTFFDGPWSRLAPGMLLAARAMQWAAEEGLTYYDFTIGNEDYKSRLGANAHDLMEIVSMGSWRGFPAVAFVRLKAWAKCQPRLVAAVRKVQSLRR